MRLLTLRTQTSNGISTNTVAVRQDGTTLTEIDGFTDVGALLKDPAWEAIAKAANGATHPSEGADLAAVIPAPGKIICVGHNYRNHIKEMGREVPEYPTLFAKYAESLIGPNDDLALPQESDAVDWEAELAVVIGKTGRRIAEADAKDHIAGYAVLNDVSMRDYQFRTVQWLQGKTWEKSTPFGPALVTQDEFSAGPLMTSAVDGEIQQQTPTSDLVFTPEFLVSYISTIITLNPGDVIATGTPGGVGHAQDPKRYLQEGQLLVTTIEGLGQLTNRVVKEA
ncbi:fumarylacetoacetate hydrolase family protein [Pseudarthrobacter raffinosi]|uniref:fumarylacetoacetate hydrolase family protein n=1 Tax=Pseudarthrobacter raffinosi TaxID=2953651 RepID=UPI00208DF3AD|nr:MULTISPECIES: fumarylacetoacetate hydrolase family protein [unclassified Pseudarthrobacter]MCO4249913.1 fumarylacetoacetate hydrolase family protein [Pseudarthrobacter sp. MDT3-9]MCO4262368.1 fumarylacetoacetate hydrolase family protein [Pseudarthrobacter sp. MDT3-26]